MNRTFKTELCEMDSNYWYITLEKVIFDKDDVVYYTIKKEHSDDGRSKSSIQLDEKQMNILMELINEMFNKVKE